MSVDLRGSVALVTGGGTGLGRAISLALARAGADVAIGYSVSTDDAEATEAELRALGIRSSALQGDLRSWKTARLIVEEVQRRHGSLDILVNNAGV
ncbi:MAG TPA: SDR family NAD(P)-dependent oxidoreductase, partial [Candidatus Saccharimonadales bacterium]|nr:SDR family NAD(P)-dependent oxidoreductase [Candidatus Saccharimonadales bacterium]